MYTNDNIVFGIDASGTCSFVLCSCNYFCCDPYIRPLQVKKQKKITIIKLEMLYNVEKFVI